MFRLGEHESVVEKCERLQWRQSFCSLIDLHRWIGTIENCHEWLRLRAHEKSINTPPAHLRVVRIGEVILVVGRMFRALDLEVLKCRAVEGAIEFSADG